MKQFNNLSVAAALMMASGALGETYTLETNEGTWDQPVLLSEQTLTKGSGGTVAFSDVTWSSGDVLVKSGTGAVKTCDALAGLTGAASEIRVTGGVLVQAGNNHLGTGTTSTAPKVTVADGATLMLTVNAKIAINNPCSFAGNGYQNLGAFCFNASARQADNLFYGTVSLAADTTFGFLTSEGRFDIKDNVNLNGHNWTVKDVRATRDSNISLCCVQGNSPQNVGAANITLDHTALLVQGGSSTYWKGGKTNCIFCINGGYVRHYCTNVMVPWLSVYEDGGYYPVVTTSYTLTESTPVQNRLGPIAISNGNFSVSQDGKTPYGVTFFGDVSGNGGITTKDVWVHLVSSNSFTGAFSATRTVEGNDSEVVLHANGALPMGCASAAVTNMPVVLCDAFQNLPDFIYNVPEGTNYSLKAKMGGAIKSLRKEGGGVLDLPSEFEIPGGVTLAGGTLKIGAPPAYSAMPGLWFGMIPTNVIPLETSMKTGASVVTSNDVAGCMDMLLDHNYPPWEYYTTASWGGYIWNRSPTNETWTFAVSVVGYSRFNFDTQNPINTDDNGGLTLWTTEVTPGPHAFLFRINPRNYSSPGAIVAPCANRTHKLGYTNFTSSVGFSIDRSGRSKGAGIKTDSSFFDFPTNGVCGNHGGDGFLFTRDPRTPEEFTDVEYCAARTFFTNLTAAAGTTLDLGAEGKTYLIDTLAGVTRITNGVLSVRQKWTLDAAATMSGTPLESSEEIRFAEGVTLDMPDLAETSHAVGSREYRLVKAPRITGFPTLTSSASTRDQWHLKQETAADGSVTIKLYYHNPTVILLR